MFRNINKNSYQCMTGKTNLKNVLCPLIDQEYRNFRQKQYKQYVSGLILCPAEKKKLKSTT